MRYLIASLALVAVSAHAGPYRCVGPTGGIVYQDAPCAGGKQVNVTNTLVLEAEPRRQIGTWDVRVGMTAAEVDKAMKGQGFKPNSTETANAIKVQRVYHDAAGTPSYVYLTNGVVTAIQR